MPSLPAALESVIAELTAMLEPLRIGAVRRPPLTLVARGGQYECYRTDRDPPVFLRRIRLDNLAAAKLPRELLSQPVEIRLDAAQVLSKVLQLPAASRHYLGEVVGHQLERMTPWSADRVVFDYVLADDAPAGKEQIEVRLVAASREVFDKAMAELAQAGIEPAVVGTSADPLERPSPVNLFRAGKTGRQRQLRRAVGMGLAGLAVAGLLLSLLSGLRLYALNAQAAQLQADMSQARSEIASRISGMQLSESRGKILAEKRAGVPKVLLLEQLSALIPTGTFLTELAAEGEEVRIAGFSGDAPALIGILEGADLLTEARFAAPTTRDEQMGQDRFEIMARIVPPASPAQ